MERKREDERVVRGEGYIDRERSDYDYERLDRRPFRLRNELRKGITYFVVILALMLVFFVLYRIDDIAKGLSALLKVLAPLFYGLAFAYLINPMANWFEERADKTLGEHFGISDAKRRKGMSRGFGIGVSLVIIIAFIIILLNMVIPQLYSSIRSMITTLPHQINEWLDKLESMESASTTGTLAANSISSLSETFENWLRKDLAEQVTIYMNYLTSGVRNFVGVFVNIVVGLIIAIYILFSKEKFKGQCKKGIYACLPVDRANFFLSLVRKSDEIFGGFVTGKLLDSLIIGILCFIGMSIFRISANYTLLISVIVGVTNVVPFFGPYIGAIPSAILVFLENPLHGLYFLIFILVLQQIDGNIIGPKILGNSTGLSAFWVVIAILVGGGVFGLPGMLLGVPTFAVVYYIVRMVLDDHLARQGLPLASSDYESIERIDTLTGEIDYLTEEEIRRRKKPVGRSLKSFFANMLTPEARERNRMRRAAVEGKTRDVASGIRETVDQTKKKVAKKPSGTTMRKKKKSVGKQEGVGRSGEGERL